MLNKYTCNWFPVVTSAGGFAPSDRSGGNPLPLSPSCRGGREAGKNTTEQSAGHGSVSEPARAQFAPRSGSSGGSDLNKKQAFRDFGEKNQFVSFFVKILSFRYDVKKMES